MTSLPEKLTPVPELNRSILPSWIADVGTFSPSEKPDGYFVMTARGPDGAVFHVDVDLPSVVFDDTFWVQVAEPAVNILGMSVLEAEYPDAMIQTRRWEWRAAAGEGDLTENERKIIARRDELEWKAPTLTT